MVKGMEMRGTGPLPGLELLAFASFLSGFCFEEEEQSDSRNILLHPAKVLSPRAQTLSGLLTTFLPPAWMPFPSLPSSPTPHSQHSLGES